MNAKLMVLTTIVVTSMSMAMVLMNRLNAHEGATGIVKERMDAMKRIEKATKVLVPMYKGQAEFDGQMVSELAAILAHEAGRDMLRLFPEGTNEHPSEALDQVWENWVEFEALAEEMREVSSQLSESAPTGREATISIFSAVLKTCHNCHEDFRKKH